MSVSVRVRNVLSPKSAPSADTTRRGNHDAPTPTQRQCLSYSSPLTLSTDLGHGHPGELLLLLLMLLLLLLLLVEWPYMRDPICTVIFVTPVAMFPQQQPPQLTGPHLGYTGHKTAGGAGFNRENFCGNFEEINISSVKSSLPNKCL